MTLPRAALPSPETSELPMPPKPKDCEAMPVAQRFLASRSASVPSYTRVMSSSLPAAGGGE